MRWGGVRVGGGQFGRRAGSALILLVLLTGAVVMLVPIYLALLNSLKTDGALLNNLWSMPAHLEWRNYTSVFRQIQFLRSLWNTVVVTVIGVSGIIALAATAGYKLARTPGRLSSFLFGLFVLSMLIPFHSIMITLTRIARDLRVQGGVIGLGLIYMGLGVSMAIFLYHGFVKAIPRELDEAARIDGCGEFRLFFRVIFPLLLPITATVAILNTLWIWNDFLLPLLMLTDSEHYTLLLSTNMLFGEYGNNEWSAILAALVLAMLPVILLYLLLQKYILKGIADGALKG